MSEFEIGSHPGRYIRGRVIPEDMSVKEAAARLGVSRAALSNLLNGKAALSYDMALRLEGAFSVKRDLLMQKQAEFDEAETRQKQKGLIVPPYVPPFMGIKANQIEDWVSDNIGSRIRLSVFLRTLIHSTGTTLTKVDFPGNDNAESKGWDGYVESSDATSWIPAGKSGWEFGTNIDISAKAESDFFARTIAIDKEERTETTFVFVTPRRWKGKDKWAAAAKAKKQWKDVCAYDASTIEQWLELSIPGQAWFADETSIPAREVRSLDQCWRDWAMVAEPPLPGSLFDQAITATKRTVISRLSNKPVGLTVVAADSVEEALAYLSQIFGQEELAHFRDRVLVVDKEGVLPRLARGAQSFIPVASTRAVEREMSSLVKAMHCISVYPRNAARDPHVVLQQVDHESFKKSLESMDKNGDEIKRLAEESGRSLTVLRRRLANTPAIQTPEWAEDNVIATSLLPLMFAGAWDSKNEADRKALETLAGISYDDVEKNCQRLIQLNDAPVWSIGNIRGVVSKIDLLYATEKMMTEADLRRYLTVARLVLGEDDPTLDLEDDQRWSAVFHGIARKFSGTFREGICETLVLLAIYGNSLFNKRLGIDLELEARKVIHELLPEPLTTRALAANDRDLPTYAEIAPETFLSILDKDLRKDAPAVLGLLRPVDTGIFGSNSKRTGLLWALEGLAWNAKTALQTVLTLANLSQVQIDDNLANKPFRSLDAIFRDWMPQTAATVDQRLEMMKRLKAAYPEIAWKICVAQFGSHHDVGFFSHKPRWRPDGYGFGERVTWADVFKFRKAMVEMALAWGELDRSKLVDLIERLHRISPEHQTELWQLLKAYATNQATESDKVELREKIRVTLLSRKAARRLKDKEGIATLTATGKEVYDLLEPKDLLHKHAWLFRQAWVEESADELYDEDNDYRKRDERITKLRIEAMSEIYAVLGFDGLMALAESGTASWSIARLIPQILDESNIVHFIRHVLNSVRTGVGDVANKKSLISGPLHSVEDAKIGDLVRGAIEGQSDDDTILVLSLAPFCRSTWKFVDGMSADIQLSYWRGVNPDWVRDDEVYEAIERLLLAKRPRTAFAAVKHHVYNAIDATVLYRLLTEISKSPPEPSDEHRLEQYHIEEAFKIISASTDLTLEQKAGLEFAFINALTRPWSSREEQGIPNLELYIEQHPEVFVQAVAWAFKRDDEGVDPTEIAVPPDKASGMAERAFHLLEGLERIPGHNEQGQLTAEGLAKWVKAVRDGCRELARLGIGDDAIGKLLSHAPDGEDGVWPCEPVRQVMEDIHSDALMSAAQVGQYNSRGAHWRGEGGAQERALADKYRKWGEALQYTHPYVSASLLMRMADGYERDARREDTEADIRKRLR